MNLSALKKKMWSNKAMTYSPEYNSFWGWKIGVENGGGSSILDDEHRADACRQLLDILPGWQTWRGADCDYLKVLPFALRNIAGPYNEIRRYSLLDFDQIPDEPLEEIWHELGRVKEKHGRRRPTGDYFAVSICKPLMFLWGQTPAFDSKTRKGMRNDHPTSLQVVIPRERRWKFSEWQAIMRDFQRLLAGKPKVTQFLAQKTKHIFKAYVHVPYGRYLDIYYF